MSCFLILACRVFFTIFANSIIIRVKDVYKRQGMVFTSYLGCFLLGCVYIAIGLLISSICENQLTAAIVTLVVNILLQVLEFVPQMLPAGSTFAFVGRLFGWLSLSTRNTEFAVGLLSPSNVLYLISFAGVLLFLTVRVIEKRRWSEN